MSEIIDMVLEEVRDDMQNALNYLENALRKIRAGKANPMMLEGIKVDYYGTMTPLTQLSNVTTLDAQTLAVKPWEKTMISAIENAIIKANLGLNPQSDAEMVRIPVPRLTEERRRELVKQAKAEGENTKIAMRGVRQKQKDSLKALEKDKDNSISEDDLKAAEKDIQDILNEYTQKVDNILKAKEADIMTV